MKKIIGLLTIAMFAGVYLFGQDTVNEQRLQKDRKFFVSIAGGPSFPVSDFASKDTSNTQAGFAKTGYHLALHAGYQFTPYIGIVSSFLYSYHKMNIAGFENEGITADHWKYYGILIGPMLTTPLGEKAKFDFKILGGMGSVNSPKIMTHVSSVYVKEDWASTFMLQCGVDLRYNISKTIYLVSNLDYNYMKPKFDLTVTGGDGNIPHNFSQKISDLDLNVGVGFNF